VNLGKAVPLQAWSGPEGSRKLRFPDYMKTEQDSGKVVRLTHRLPSPPGNAPGTHFCCRLSRPQDHRAIGRIMSMKNSNDTIWDRTSDLPICSTAPKPLCHRGLQLVNLVGFIIRIHHGARSPECQTTFIIAKFRFPHQHEKCAYSKRVSRRELQ
jgi:hypothetical protein